MHKAMNDLDILTAYIILKIYVDINMRLNDFQGKEVINSCDGKKLGYIVDFVFDEKCGQIEAIIIPKTSRFCNFFCDGSEYIIPYKCICKIGPDVILVEMHEKK